MVTTTFSMMTNLYAHMVYSAKICMLYKTQRRTFSFYNLAYDLGLVFQIRLGCTGPEGKFLDKMQTKVLWVFFLVIHSHLYSFALRFQFYQTHATSYSFCVGERRKTWLKTIPLSQWFKKSIQKPQVWELSKLCQETSMKLYNVQYVHEVGF
jgi:hypothetical protein